jgi:N-hydroxyarylamine O-acetyltransferase
MLAVPFENLDIPLGNPIALSLPALYAKIVERRRGGFCYELNGLFAWLLEQLGFRVTRLSARVFDGVQPGPQFDHLALVVETDERLLADVGFGDSFLEPLRLDGGEADCQGDRSYRVTGEGAERVLERQRAAADWEPKYVFSLQPHDLGDFAAQCRWTQTDPASSFTQKATCSLATRDGRITLSNNRLITTTASQREEREVASQEEYRALLLTHFGIDLGAGARLDRLMAPRAPFS